MERRLQQLRPAPAVVLHNADSTGQGTRITSTQLLNPRLDFWIQTAQCKAAAGQDGTSKVIRLLGHSVEVAQAILILIGNICGRRHPGRICKIEKLCSYPSGRRPAWSGCPVGASLDQLKNCSEIRCVVGNKIFLVNAETTNKVPGTQ